MSGFASATVAGITDQAVMHHECAMCFEPLHSSPAAGCMSDRNNEQRSCRHLYHHACLERVENNQCPLCRQHYGSINDIPNPFSHPREWFKFMDADNNGTLSCEEVVEGLQAILPLDYRKITEDAERLWSVWDADGDGFISYDEFSTCGVVGYLQQHYPGAPILEVPDIRQNKRGWFQYWDEDNSSSLDKNEMIRALIKTFASSNRDKIAVIQETVMMIWSIFDEDGSGVIEIDEFVAPDNFADTIIASMTHE